jgi:hypothetical protein
MMRTIAQSLTKTAERGRITKNALQNRYSHRIPRRDIDEHIAACVLNMADTPASNSQFKDDASRNICWDKKRPHGNALYSKNRVYIIKHLLQGVDLENILAKQTTVEG